MYRGYAVNGKPDESQKRCFDCSNNQATISWWCVSKEAIEHRGTSLPGIKECPFWRPIPTEEELLNEKNAIQKFFKVGLSDKWIKVNCSDNPKT
jgi:hypothetical protein